MPVVSRATAPHMTMLVPAFGKPWSTRSRTLCQTFRIRRSYIEGKRQDKTRLDGVGAPYFVIRSLI